MKTITFKLLLLGLTVICLTTHAQTTKYVTMNGAGYKDGSSWEHAYDSTGIQTAIDAMTTSSGYNMVWVAKGTYYPTTNGPFTMKPGVKLIGGFSGMEIDTIQRINYGLGEENETVLSGDIDRDEILNSTNVRVVSFSYSGDSYYYPSTSEINGFTITMGYTDGVYGAGIRIHTGSTSNSNIISPKVINNIIINNTADGESGGGIAIYAQAGGTIEAEIRNNKIIANDAQYGSGIYCSTIDHYYSSTCNPIIENNIFENNTASSGGGIYTVQSEHHECEPVISNNLFYNNIASNGGAIYISFGVYSAPGSNYYRSLHVTNNSFISNNGSSGGAIYLYCSSGSNTTYSCKATLNIDINNNDIISNAATSGGAIYCYNNGDNKISTINLTLNENNILNNNATNGGAVYLRGYEIENSITKAYISNNVICNNVVVSQGGGFFIDYRCNTSQGYISNNIIADNVASDGAGIFTESTIKISKNRITNNYSLNNGSGACLLSRGSNNESKIFENIIFNNQADALGGGIYCKSSTTGYNCTPEITSCTFANNEAGVHGDNICTFAEVSGSICTPVITNSIVWGGSSPYYIDVSGSGSCPPNTTYCAIQGVFTGEGNIDLSTDNIDGPMFLLPTSFIGNAQTSADTLELENANWNVSVCSPVVNAGLNSAVPSDLTTDFNGDERIFGGTVDIGAYEQQSSIDVPVTITGLTSACDGETLTLDAGEGFSGYEWTGGTTDQTMEVTETNTYSVTVSDINGCTGTDEITVTFHEIPSSIILGETEACEGESITLSVTVTDQYSWSTGSTAQTIGVTETGSYYITVTSEYECQSNDSIDIIIHPLPIISIDGNDFACQGNSEILTATTGFENYEWLGGEDTESITVNETGAYSVTVTDINNCENSYEFEFTVYDPTPEFTNSTDACIGDIIELSLSENFESYDWSNFTSESTLQVTENGTYSVTVHDDHACTASASLDMTFHELPVPEITGEENACYGQPVTFDAGDYSLYLWSNDESSQTISASVTGNYSVSVTDEFGCTGTDNIDLTVFSLPIPSISGDTEACDGEYIDLLVNEFANYEWSTSSNSQSITVSTSGEYTVTVTDLNNCQGTDSYNVTFHTLPVPEILGNDEACDGETITLDAGVFTSYVWNDATTERLNDVTLSGNYSVIVTDVHGCTGNDDIDITFHPIPATPTITRNEFVLTSSSATGNQWYLDGTGITGANSRNYTCTADGDYSIVVTSEYGCVSSESQEVNVFGTNIASFEAYGISLYPNPANEQIWINTDGTYIGSVIQIQNNLGQIIIEQQISSENTQIMLLDIPAGHYLVTIITEEAVLNSKFIKL